MRDYRADIAAYLELEKETLNRLDIGELNRAMQALEDAYEKETSVYIFGNGGSAATASHFVCDFNKGISGDSPKKFRLRCLNDNIPTLMAVANDIGYEDIFVYQLKGILKEEDTVVAISGSGNSPNIIKAVEYAREQGAAVIGLTGYQGGRLKELSDISLHVPIENMQVTEDVHMIFDHMMMSILSKYLSNGRECNG